MSKSYLVDVRTELEKIPHNCSYRDVTGWDLVGDDTIDKDAAINYAFKVAFGA